METIPGVARTVRGTQARTPIADLIFSVATGRVLRTIRPKLQAMGVASSATATKKSQIFGAPGIEVGDVIEFDDISYVDDAVFPVLAGVEAPFVFHLDATPRYLPHSLSELLHR